MIQGQTSHSEICPVCNGSGKYKKYINHSNTTYNAYSYCENICHRCDGKGWVTVEDPIEVYGGIM